MVHTRRGFLPIEEVRTGDRVLTHTGSWQRVFSTSSRQHRGLLTRVTYTRYGEPLECTHDHMIRVRSMNGNVAWRKAHTVLPGEFLVMPRPLTHGPLGMISLPQEVYHETHFFNDWGTKQRNGKLVVLPRTFEVTNNLLFLFGWYLAEGFSSTKKGKGSFVSLSGNIRDRKIVERCGKIFSSWGVHTHLSAIDNKVELRAYSIELAKWFSFWFGRTARKKYIPAELLDLPKAQSRYLLEGYLAGDGYRRRNQTEWNSVSPTLATQMALLALRCGEAPTLRRIAKGKNEGLWIGGYTTNGQACNPRLSVWDESCVYHPIHKVETFYARRRPPTHVYDLSVEGDHSFVVGQAAVHNCHRIGQTETVHIISLICQGTVDESVERLLAKKQRMTDEILKETLFAELRKYT